MENVGALFQGNAEIQATSLTSSEKCTCPVLAKLASGWSRISPLRVIYRIPCCANQRRRW